MTSSIYGITVTALVMYIFLGTAVSMGKRRNFAHVFGKRNDGYFHNSVNGIYEKQHTDPLLDKIRLYQTLHRSRNNKEDVLSDTFFSKQNGDLEKTTQSYEDQPSEDSVSLLDILSPVEKDYLALLFDMDNALGDMDKYPSYN